jgi:mono/diheme cytochrome c family protein
MSRSLLPRQRNVLLALAISFVILLAACAGVAEPAPPVNLQGSAGGAESTPDAVSFSQDVLPILQSRCVNCHGGQRTEKKLDMTSYEKLMAGSEKGAVVIPGDADNSSFIQLVLQGKMPKRGPKLLPEQVQTLVDWVKAGALNN